MTGRRRRGESAAGEVIGRPAPAAAGRPRSARRIRASTRRIGGGRLEGDRDATLGMEVPIAGAAVGGRIGRHGSRTGRIARVPGMRLGAARDRRRARRCRNGPGETVELATGPRRLCGDEQQGEKQRRPPPRPGSTPDSLGFHIVGLQAQRSSDRRYFPYEPLFLEPGCGLHARRA